METIAIGINENEGKWFKEMLYDVDSIIYELKKILNIRISRVCHKKKSKLTTPKNTYPPSTITSTQTSTLSSPISSPVLSPISLSSSPYPNIEGGLTKENPRFFKVGNHVVSHEESRKKSNHLPKSRKYIVISLIVRDHVRNHILISHELDLIIN